MDDKRENLQDNDINTAFSLTKPSAPRSGPQEVCSAIPAMSKSATSAFSIHSWLAARSNKSQLQQKTNIIVQKELDITAVVEPSKIKKKWERTKTEHCNSGALDCKLGRHKS